MANDDTPLERCPSCGKRFVEDRKFEQPISLGESREYVQSHIRRGEHVTQPCPGCGFDLDENGLRTVLSRQQKAPDGG